MSAIGGESGAEMVTAPAFEESEERRQRMDAGTVRATPRDRELLRFVGEQFAISMVQLQSLMGVRNDRTVRRVRDRWRKAGWVQSRGLITDGPTMVWLTARGHRAAGVDYGVWTPSEAMARHIVAVTEVRLLLARQLPDTRWVSERDLARDEYASKAPHRPDGLVTDGDARIAIEVDLTQKSRRRLFEIARDVLKRYDGAWYFAAPEAIAPLERVAAEIGDERLVVRALPAELCR
jgi:hypothetical protein